MAVPRESLATLDLREPPDLRVRRAREDPPVRRALPDLLEAVELEELLAPVECPGPREDLAQLACPALVVPLVHPELVEAPEMLAVLESLV